MWVTCNARGSAAFLAEDIIYWVQVTGVKEEEESNLCCSPWPGSSALRKEMQRRVFRYYLKADVLEDFPFMYSCSLVQQLPGSPSAVL